jgi:hypothetical protein
VSLKCWYSILREEQRFRMFEKRMLRVMYGLRREKVTRGWKKLHKEELYYKDFV